MTERTTEVGKVVEAYKQDLTTACELVLADEIPSDGVDLLFIHGRAIGHPEKGAEPDFGTLFGYTKEVYDKGLVRGILIFGHDGQKFVPDSDPQRDYEMGIDKYTANPGKAEFLRRLDEQGFNIADTRDGDEADPIYLTGPRVRHTKEEVESVLEFMKMHGFKSVALLAHPHQNPRAMLAMIGVLNSQGETNISVYTAHPPRTDWEEIAGGSQGQDPKLRRLHAGDEMARIPVYQKQGNLAPFSELRAYYISRDGGLERMQRLLVEKQKDPNFQTDLQVLKDAVETLPSEKLSQLIVI